MQVVGITEGFGGYWELVDPVDVTVELTGSKAAELDCPPEDTAGVADELIAAIGKEYCIAVLLSAINITRLTPVVVAQIRGTGQSSGSQQGAIRRDATPLTVGPS